MGQTPRSKSQVKIMVPTERSNHRKYQSSSTNCSKIVSKIKVFKKWVKLKGQGHRVKNTGTHGKILSQGIFSEISELL